MSFNRVMLMGETVAAPVVGRDTDGRPSASFDVLVEKRWVGPEGQEKTYATRVPVVAVQSAFEVSRGIRGPRETVMVEGRLFCESSKIDEKWHSRSFVIAHRLELGGPPSAGERLEAPSRPHEAFVAEAREVSLDGPRDVEVERPREVALERPREVEVERARPVEDVLDASRRQASLPVAPPPPSRRGRPARGPADAVGAGAANGASVR